MRYSLVAIAATALLGSVSARGHSHRRHAHAAHVDLAPREIVPEVVPDECVCSTYVTSYLVEVTLTPEPTIVSDATTTVQAVKTVVPIGEVDATYSIPPAEGSGVPGSGVPGTDVGAPSGAPSTGVPSTGVPSTGTSTGVPAAGAPSGVAPTDELTTTISSTVTHTETSTSLTTITTYSSEVDAVSSVSGVASAPATTPAGPVPTQQVTTIATPGIYTIPATTVTLTSTEVVCVPETTSLPAGQQTYGGVTTIVETSTTVVCPLATVEVDDGVTTSKIYTTTYICPTAGTYTIGATTTDVPAPTTVEYPVPTAYAPGTYVQPEVVTTITVTSQVVTCPLFTAAPTSDATSTAVAVVPTTTAAPAVPTSTAGSTTAPADSIVSSVSSVVATVIPSNSVSSAAPAASSAVGEITSNGGLWAITYSPYANGGGCKTAEEVETDVASIASKGFQNIRIYSTDCSGLENVGGSAEKHGLGLILGIFLKAGCGSTGADQIKDIIAWGKWDMIVLVVIGNEAVFNGYCSASELAGYMTSVGSELKNAGYSGPVTTTEPLNILQSYGASDLCAAMDVIGVNIHPFFNAGTAASDAGTFLSSQVALTEAVCSGKKAWVLECGWPSSGEANGLAVPGVAQQATAVAAMVAALPGRVAYFTFTDDYWKAPGAYNVEQHFGLAQLFTS
ncbi:uncharacterized protein LAJ45_04537 [Morchella importuna]|uniref:uncharacterized protein n=1 Tax=Morchella importuna TaxID=1174673 RepID=UPI001E8DF47C|nr:uncharacterized protein LAJ45_04537 [Morchella importuna]KAH8151335.1 hypothetical protein LAJ45_04537 [Morchella importuna]